MGIVSVLSPTAILRQLRQGEESSTFERLGRSRHVADLRMIFSVTVIIMIVAVILAPPFCFWHELMDHWKDVRDRHSDWILARLFVSAIADSGTFIGAIGALGCGVLAWTYQTGSARLGVVDLFACEIATLCRVAAVIEMVHRYVALYHTGPHAMQPHDMDGEPPTDTSRFTSQESYFPVFDSSVKDLQALEADVVTNVTAFYTYMKVMRDSLRKLADIKPPPPGEPVGDDWHRAICNVVYMQFLALESARKAIKDLVEFEPTQAEDMLTILLNEIVAYGFLRVRFKGDLRERRLDARGADYRREVPELCRMAMAASGPKWEKAQDTAVELMKRYAQVFPMTAPLPARERELV
jgi:hypothetical protein